ncbi:MAG: hypothetical protein WC102_11125, partial [Saccharofermentanales bacterium]
RGCPMRMRRLHAMTLRLGIAARDESRYSVIFSVMSDGVAGFNLRSCPMRMERAMATVLAT